MAGVRTRFYLYIYIYIYIYTHTYIHTYKHTHTHTHTYTHTHIHTNIHTHTHIHTYIHTYIHTHTHTHTYIHTYTHSPIRLHGGYKDKITFSCLNRTMSKTDSVEVTAYDRSRLATSFLRTISNSVFHSFTQHDICRQFPTNAVSF